MIGQGDENGICFFHPYRLGRGRPSVKTIRRSCLECMGENREFVRECWDPDCPVWPYRMGRNPRRAGQGNIDHIRKDMKGGSAGVFSPQKRRSGR